MLNKRRFVRMAWLTSVLLIIICFQNCGSELKSSSLEASSAQNCENGNCNTTDSSTVLIKNCLFNGETLTDGQTIQAYFNSMSSNCVSEVRICNDGKLSGNYLYSSCNQVLRACLFNGQTILSGQSTLAFMRNTNGDGSISCLEENRMCSDGILSGQYALASCTPIPNQAPCTFNGITLISGQNITAYRESSVVSPQACTSEQRACNNGTLSGSLTYPSCVVNSPSAPTNTGFNDSLFYVGHSLVGPTMPQMLQTIIDSKSGSGRVDFQVINGSPLKYNWENSASAQGSNSRSVLPQGRHKVLVITEAVPLKNHTTYSQSNELALQFYNLAQAGYANAKVYMYETWHCINSGLPAGCEYDNDDNIGWRQRLDLELSRWEGIVDYVNENKTNSRPTMYLVPAGQAMARMNDEINAGRVPGITSIRELFSDDIHPNALGFYFVSMVQYATIYGLSPVGLPRNLVPSNSSIQTPSLALAEKMQAIAWETVCQYPRSGVSCR